jgi:hypothetical protein
MNTQHKPEMRYTMEDARTIYKTALHILTEARLEAMAKVRDDLLSMAGSDVESLTANLPALRADLPVPPPEQLEQLRSRLTAATVAHMAPKQLAEGVTVRSIAAHVGIDLHKFAEDAWQGFEGTFTAVIEGAVSNV